MELIFMGLLGLYIAGCIMHKERQATILRRSLIVITSVMVIKTLIKKRTQELTRRKK